MVTSETLQLITCIGTVATNVILLALVIVGVRVLRRIK